MQMEGDERSNDYFNGMKAQDHANATVSFAIFAVTSKY